jgi:hypothetical protein
MDDHFIQLQPYLNYKKKEVAYKNFISRVWVWEGV